jgi:hypothetical protein
MKQNITDLRLEIDILAQATASLETSTSIRDCYSSLMYAKAWLGKLLGEFANNPSPYKDGKKSISDIEPTADKAEMPSKEVQEKYLEGVSHIERVDSLRQGIGRLALIARQLTDLPSSREAAICRTQTWVYLCEARFALGFEFERIRAEHDKAV